MAHPLPNEIEVNTPEFKSLIPDHLLHGASEQTKYIMHQLSINNQQNEWIINLGLKHDKTIKILEEKRLKKIEDDITTIMEWKTMLSNKWSVIIAFVIFLGGFVQFCIYAFKFLKFVLIK